MSEEKLALGYLGDIHISKHRDRPVFIQQDVGSFDISMDDVYVVQILKTMAYLVQVSPHYVLRQ